MDNKSDEIVIVWDFEKPFGNLPKNNFGVKKKRRKRKIKENN